MEDMERRNLDMRKWIITYIISRSISYSNIIFHVTDDIDRLVGDTGHDISISEIVSLDARSLYLVIEDIGKDGTGYCVCGTFDDMDDINHFIKSSNVPNVIYHN